MYTNYDAIDSVFSSHVASVHAFITVMNQAAQLCILLKVP